MTASLDATERSLLGLCVVYENSEAQMAGESGEEHNVTAC